MGREYFQRHAWRRGYSRRRPLSPDWVALWGKIEIPLAVLACDNNMRRFGLKSDEVESPAWNAGGGRVPDEFHT